MESQQLASKHKGNSYNYTGLNMPWPDTSLMCLREGGVFVGDALPLIFASLVCVCGDIGGTMVIVHNNLCTNSLLRC